MILSKEQINEMWDTHYHSRSSFYWLDFAEALLLLLDANLSEDEVIDLWNNHCLTRLATDQSINPVHKNKGIQFAQDIIYYVQSHH